MTTDSTGLDLLCSLDWFESCDCIHEEKREIIKTQLGTSSHVNLARAAQRTSHIEVSLPEFMTQTLSTF